MQPNYDNGIEICKNVARLYAHRPRQGLTNVQKELVDELEKHNYLTTDHPQAHIYVGDLI